MSRIRGILRFLTTSLLLAVMIIFFVNCDPPSSPGPVVQITLPQNDYLFQFAVEPHQAFYLPGAENYLASITSLKYGITLGGGGGPAPPGTYWAGSQGPIYLSLDGTYAHEHSIVLAGATGYARDDYFVNKALGKGNPPPGGGDDITGIAEPIPSSSAELAATLSRTTNLSRSQINDFASQYAQIAK